MKNNFQKISLILSAVFFIALSAMFVFLYGKINDSNRKAEENMIKWQQEANRRNEIISLDRSLQNMQGDRTQLETHFAKNSDVVPFLDTIEKLAPKVGAVAQVDSVETFATNTGLSVGLKASGSFAEIYKFLTLLENSPYELDFVSMDMRKLAPDTSVKNVQNSKWEVVFKIQLLSFVP